MEGGRGVHSKFMHILVQEFVSSRKHIVSYLVFFASFRFLEEYKVINSRNQCPPEYGTVSSVVTDVFDLSYLLVSFRDLTFLYWL